MTFDPNDPSTDRRSLSRRGGERRSGIDRRTVHAESHPPISDPSHPDHGEWQHEFVDAPAPDDVAAITAATQKARDDEEAARIAAAEASAANAAEQAAAAQEPVEPAPVEPAPVEPAPVEPAKSAATADASTSPGAAETYVSLTAPATPEQAPVEPAQ